MILGVYFMIGYIFLLLFGAAFVVSLFYRCRKKQNKRKGTERKNTQRNDKNN